MPSFYKVNNQLVTAETFEELQNKLETYYPEIDSKVFEDRQITPAEIVDFFDRTGNRDGKLTYFDLQSLKQRIGNQNFSDLNTLLRRLHFDPHAEAQDVKELEDEQGGMLTMYDGAKGQVTEVLNILDDSQLALTLIRVDEAFLLTLTSLYQREKGKWKSQPGGPTAEEIERKFKQLLENKVFLLEAVRQNGWALEYVPEPFKQDKEIILAAIRQTAFAIVFVSQDHPSYVEFVLEALKQNWRVTRFLGEKWYADRRIALALAKDGLSLAADIFPTFDRETMLEVLKLSPVLLEYAPDEFKANRELVLLAVEKDPVALAYVHPKFRGDRQVVLTAVKHWGSALQYAASKFQADKEVVLTALKDSAEAIAYVAPELRRDRQVAFTAIEKDGRTLQHLPDFQNDRELVLKAIENSVGGTAFTWASPTLQKDRTIVLAAIKKGYPGPLLDNFIGPFKEDREIALEIVLEYDRGLEFVSGRLRSDRELVLNTILNHPLALEYAGPFRKDRKLVLEAVRRDGLALAYADPSLQNDWGVVSEAVQKNFLALHYASPQLKSNYAFLSRLIREGVILRFTEVQEIPPDPNLKITPDLKIPSNRGLYKPRPEITFDFDEDLLREAFQKNVTFFLFLPPSLQNDPKVELELVRKKGRFLRFLPSNLRNNRDIVVEAVRQDGLALEYASAELQGDYAIVNIAIEQNPLALQYASEALQKNKAFLKFVLSQVDYHTVFHSTPDTDEIFLVDHRFRDKEKRLLRIMDSKITETNWSPGGYLEFVAHTNYPTTLFCKVTPLAHPNKVLLEDETHRSLNAPEKNTFNEVVRFDFALSTETPYQLWVKPEDGFWQMVGEPFQFTYDEEDIEEEPKKSPPPPSPVPKRRPLPPDPGEIK